jgi:hypoxanthine phosphoribosyltransferase
LSDRGRLELFISSRRIKKRVPELAKKISNDYKGKVPVFIGILNGSFIFMSDLLREVELETEIDFLKLSSYGDKKISTRNVRLLKELNCDIVDRDVIIVEDIIDSGLSVNFIRELILKHKPKSVEFATLLYKKEISKLDFKLKYFGFKIPNRFVVGYGLDYAQKYRNLKSIYILNN